MEKVARYKSEYDRNGAVLVRDWLSDEWIDKVRAAIEKVYTEPSKEAQHFCQIGGSGHHFRDFGNWQKVPEVKDVIWNSPVAKLAAGVMDSQSVTLYYDQVMVKESRDLHLSPYHVEMSSYPFIGEQGCAVVIPIDTVPLECSLKFVQGSHLWKKTYYPGGVGREPRNPDENHLHECDQIPDIRSMKEAMVLEWTMNPGDVLVYNMKTLMASNGNVTNSIQRALVVHWFGDDVKYRERTWAIFPPITGKLVAGDHPSKDPQTFPLVYPPPAESSQAV